jgi:hypothetical protein
MHGEHGSTWRCRAAVAVLGWVAAASAGAHAGVIHVDDDALPGGDGLTWPTAYRFLQDALAVAVDGDEIRVAEGEYRPDRDELHPHGTGAREATFHLVDGVRVKGGYTGPGSDDPDERDIDDHVSTLSGDLLGDDGPDRESYDENSYHVVTASGTARSAVLDGFVISAGNADGLDDLNHGGGMFNDRGHATVVDCTFAFNRAHTWRADCGWTGGGGGMYNRAGDPRILDCTFIHNVSIGGGGMLNVESHPVVSGGTFSGNATDGMRNVDSNPVVSDCHFLASSHAGCPCLPDPTVCGRGMWNIRSHPEVVNCVFSENGVGMTNSDGHAAVRDCLFTENGVGMINGASDPTLVRCVFTRNGLLHFEGGGMRNHDSNPRVTDCSFSDNAAEAGGGMWNTGRSSPPVGGSLFCGSSPDHIWGSWTDEGENEFLDECPCDADLDADGSVGFGDLLVVLSDWGDCDPSCPADLDGNGNVGFVDLLMLLARWGPCT